MPQARSPDTSQVPTAPARPRARRVPRPIERGHVFTKGPFEVPGLGGRHVTVYLPPRYDQSPDRSYPLAYMLDGQNVFGDEGSFAGGWRMHLILDRLHARRHPVPIVVGIHHGGHSRVDELSPWHFGGGGGKADQFFDWVAGPLHGLVTKGLRTLPGPQNVLIGGASMAGLGALYALFARPDVFGAALAMSPSLWVGGGRIFRYVSQVSMPWTCKVYVDGGGREPGALRAAREMGSLLARRGLSAGHHLMCRLDARGWHNERSWRRRLPAALRFLYPR